MDCEKNLLLEQADHDPRSSRDGIPLCDARMREAPVSLNGVAGAATGATTTEPGFPSGNVGWNRDDEHFVCRPFAEYGSLSVWTAPISVGEALPG